MGVIWGLGIRDFPKLGVPFWEVPKMKVTEFWGLY